MSKDNKTQVNIDLSNRRTLVSSLNNENFQKGVEIGVRNGWYSKYILDNTGMSIECIDPWDQNPELSVGWEESYQKCASLLANHIESGRCRMVRDYSPQAASQYEDETFDFVYIDGLHDYESVKADLEAWYPKVKKGKLLCGHDYNPKKWPGVVRAVEEFCVQHSLKKHLTGIVGNAVQSHTGDLDEYDGDEYSYVLVKS